MLAQVITQKSCLAEPHLAKYLSSVSLLVVSYCHLHLHLWFSASLHLKFTRGLKSFLMTKSESVSCSVVSDSLQLMDCSPPGSSVHGVLQARILEWVAISFSRGSSQPRDQTLVSCTAGKFFTVWTTREAPLMTKCHSKSFQSECLHVGSLGISVNFLISPYGCYSSYGESKPNTNAIQVILSQDWKPLLYSKWVWTPEGIG